MTSLDVSPGSLIPAGRMTVVVEAVERVIVFSVDWSYGWIFSVILGEVRVKVEAEGRRRSTILSTPSCVVEVSPIEEDRLAASEMLENTSKLRSIIV